MGNNLFDFKRRFFVEYIQLKIDFSLFVFLDFKAFPSDLIPPPASISFEATFVIQGYFSILLKPTSSQIIMWLLSRIESGPFPSLPSLDSEARLKPSFRCISCFVYFRIKPKFSARNGNPNMGSNLARLFIWIIFISLVASQSWGTMPRHLRDKWFKNEAVFNWDLSLF